MGDLPAVHAEAPATVIGGYGQLQARYLGVGPDPDWTGEATLRRLVVYISHDFSDAGAPIRSTVELEWENAIAGDGQPGTAEVEQAFLSARLKGEALQLQGGLLLVPFGLSNHHHEPPTFLSVDRPSTEQIVIPTTWRELGVGITGRAGPLRYELDALTALDPAALSDAGLANARSSGANSPALAGALAGRLEAEPVLGLLLGLSGYASDMGPARPWFDAAGERLDLSLPLLGAALDLRWRSAGFEAKALGARFWLPESDDLITALKEDGSPYFLPNAAPVASQMSGAYAELGWNVLHFAETSQELVPFARLEAYDTQERVPDGTTANPLRAVKEGTYGLCYRPIPAIAVKADVQLRDRRYGDDELQGNAGLGFLF